MYVPREAQKVHVTVQGTYTIVQTFPHKEKPKDVMSIA